MDFEYLLLKSRCKQIESKEMNPSYSFASKEIITDETEKKTKVNNSNLLPSLIDTSKIKMPNANLDEDGSGEHVMRIWI